MLYQYLGTDDDEDNPSPEFGAQSAGYATSETDAEHQAEIGRASCRERV